MKLLLLLLAGMALPAGDLSQVRTVYILSMAGGLDLHIANRLTDGHVLQVVTDPKNADAILTDKLGPGFEDRMAELYPPPEPPKPAPKEKDKDATPGLPALGEASNKIPKLVSNFGGGKGTIFLVSVKSRDVLWSTYAKPKDARGDSLERTAGKIASDLKKSMSAK
jgi:hypothetical protein